MILSPDSPGIEGLLKIREARRTDAADIARVHVDSWRSAYPGLVPDRVLVSMSRQRHQAQWTRDLDHPRVRHVALVAAMDGAQAGTGDAGDADVVGFGSCGPVRNASLKHKGEVYTLYVHPDHQDLGIGRALLHGLFDCLLARGMDSAMVWVLADNPSRFFYESMGGRRVAVRDECLWGTVLGEAAYGWSDLRAALTGHHAQRRS